MKHICICLFLSLSIFTFSQDNIRGKVRARTMPMSEMPDLFNMNSDHFAHFSFGQAEDGMNLKITLWETSLEKDSLTSLVLLNEDMTKTRRKKIDVLVDKNKLQIDIISIVANEMAIITPIKSEYGFIQPFRFNTKPKVHNKEVPVVLLIDTSKEIDQEEIKTILNKQDIDFLQPQAIRKLKKQIGKFKILTYHLKKLS